MRRYWFESIIADQSHVVLEGDLFHHIIDVCRQNQGSRFELISPDGYSRLVEVEHLGKRQALLRVLDKKASKKISPPFLHVALSIPKLATLESVLEKCVELGVAHFHPFVSEHSFFKTCGKISEDRVERWQRIVVSATQQSGRGELLNIHNCIDLDGLCNQISRSENPLCLFAYEGSTQMGIKKFLKKNWTERTQQDQSPVPQNVWLVIGGEGGFSEAEAQLLSQRGYDPVGLGDQVLRVETACITLVSILKYELGLMETH